MSCVAIQRLYSFRVLLYSFFNTRKSKTVFGSASVALISSAIICVHNPKLEAGWDADEWKQGREDIEGGEVHRNWPRYLDRHFQRRLLQESRAKVKFILHSVEDKGGPCHKGGKMSRRGRVAYPSDSLQGAAGKIVGCDPTCHRILQCAVADIYSARQKTMSMSVER